MDEDMLIYMAIGRGRGVVLNRSYNVEETFLWMTGFLY